MYYEFQGAYILKISTNQSSEYKIFGPNLSTAYISNNQSSDYKIFGPNFFLTTALSTMHFRVLLWVLYKIYYDSTVQDILWISEYKIGGPQFCITTAYISTNQGVIATKIRG